MVDPRAEPYSSLPHVGPENIEAQTGHLFGVRSARECGLISAKYEFDEHAIIYSKIRPNLNKVTFPRFKGVSSADAYPLWADESVILTEFLEQVLRSPDFVRQAVAVSARTGMPKINRQDLGRLSIPVPPLSRQRGIAAVLTSSDRVCSVVRDLSASVREMKRGLMYELLTGRRRFSEFGAFVWQEVRLGDVFDERDELARTDLPLLAITGRQGVIPRNELERRDSSPTDKSKYKRIAPGDIGYNTMRMWQGVSGLSRLEGIVSPAYTVVVPRREKILPAFAAHLFKAPEIIDRFRRLSQGLVDDTLNLKYPILAHIRLSLPPLAEQERIAELLDAVDARLVSLERLRRQLEIQKVALASRLLCDAYDR
jgi:type I restriction enzyme S subunit